MLSRRHPAAATWLAPVTWRYGARSTPLPAAKRAGHNAVMPHITLNSDDPGIRGLLRYRPETAQPLSGLTEVLLRGPSTLTRGERELIAAHVSALNDCR
jgi:hypothetical protein